MKLWIVLQALGDTPEEWGYKGDEFYGVYETEQLAVDECLRHRVTCPPLFVFPVDLNAPGSLELSPAPGYYPSKLPEPDNV